MLRIFRVLRVLRAINKLKMLKTLVQAIFMSAPMLISSAMLVLLLVLIFAIAGIQFFKGALRSRCYDPLMAQAPTVDGQPCGSLECPDGQSCGIMSCDIPNTYGCPNGLTGFDNMGVAMLSVLQVIQKITKTTQV